MGILFENCDLLLRGEDGVYSTLHGFLGVRGDTIDYIGTEKPTGEYEEHKNMEHKLLMPGLINCHNHSPMVLLRGVGSGLPLQEWLFGKVFPIEDRLVPADIARDAGERHDELFRYVLFPRRDGRRRRGSGHEGKHQPLRAVL